MRDQAYLYSAEKDPVGRSTGGEAVSELIIAKELENSRTPIREALGQLVAEGRPEHTLVPARSSSNSANRTSSTCFEMREAL